MCCTSGSESSCQPSCSQFSTVQPSQCHSSIYILVCVQIRKAAVDMVQGLSATTDGAQQLRTANDELLPALLWLMNDESHVSKAALTSLINLSQVGLQTLRTLATPCRNAKVCVQEIPASWLHARILRMLPRTPRKDVQAPFDRLPTGYILHGGVDGDMGCSCQLGLEFAASVGVITTQYYCEIKAGVEGTPALFLRHNC